MIYKCILETDGYRAIFELTGKQLSKYTVDTDVDLVVELQLDPDLRDISVRSICSYIALKDLQRLATYLQKHIALLMEETKANIGVFEGQDSEAFVNYGLGFSLQAFTGNVYSETDGNFTIQVMVNIGRNKHNGNTYWGGESGVEVVHVQNFISSINTAVELFLDR